MASFGAGNPYGDPNWYNGVPQNSVVAAFLSRVVRVCAGLPQPILQRDA